MSISIKPDSWHVKDGNGQYRGTAIFSSMLPSEAQQIVTESIAEINAVKATIPADYTELVDEVDGLTDDVVDVLNAISGLDNLNGIWRQISFTSATGSMGLTALERSSTMIYVPHDVLSFTCPDINSCVSAWHNDEYIGVLDNNGEFKKAFTNVNTVDFQELFERYPNYEYRITVYCYPDDINEYVTIRKKNSSQLDTQSMINTLGKYIESYYKIAQGEDTNLGYASRTGLFAESVSDSQGVNCIQCSELVYAALCKIMYNNSRYVITSNIPSRQGWSTDGSVADLNYNPSPYIYEDYLQADQLAKYFDGKGELITFNEDHNNMYPGDLVFYGVGTNNTYKNITHCCVALNYDQRNKSIRTVDGSEGAKVNGDPAGVNYSLLPVTNAHVYYARPHILTDPYTTSKIAEQYIPENSISSETGKTLTQYSIMVNLEPGFYTAIIDDSACPNLLTYIQERCFRDTARTDYVDYMCRPLEVQAQQIIQFAVPESIGGNEIFVNGANLSDVEILTPVIRCRIFKGWVADDPEI